MIDKISAEEESDIDRPPRKRKKETSHEKLLPGKLNRLTPEDGWHTGPIIIKYPHAMNI